MKLLKDISIRSTWVLSVVAILSVLLLISTENTKVIKEEDWYREKIDAAKLAQKAMRYLKNARFKNQFFIDNINDPNETGLVGEEYTLITTGNGSLPVKMSCLNPNMAAMVVQQLKDAGLEKGDQVGVCLTGSFPGLNICTYAALQTLGIKPIIISSVTASSWGANDPEFTFLDMESSLFKAGIFSIKSNSASIGGNSDVGRALSRDGRTLVKEAISRNNLHLINTGSLVGNINERIEKFKSKNIKCFINIGGGIASTGSERNGLSISSGLNENTKLNKFIDKRGVMFEMARQNIPIIHLLKIEELLTKYDLPVEPIPLPNIGEGKLFKAKKYQIGLTSASLGFLIILLLAIIYIDKKQHALGKEILKTEDDFQPDKQNEFSI